jgi:hypothetical protein
MTLQLSGTYDIGERGEEAVIGLVVDALRGQGRTVSRVDAKDARNDRGEDARLVCDGQTVIVQVVTAPDDPQLLAAAARGVARTETTPAAAVGWLSGAIDRKALHYDAASKRSMLLAIDVRHMGVVVRLVDSNLRARAAATGFGAVWLVGPTTQTTVMLFEAAAPR